MQNKQQILDKLEEIARLTTETHKLMTSSFQPPEGLTLPWMTQARMLLGVREIPGEESHPAIVKMQELTRYVEPHGDDTPWCAAFVCYALSEARYQHTSSAAARSFLKCGTELNEPKIGCIVVFERGAGGHVGFLYAIEDLHYHILGGNQGNEVCVKKYPRTRVLNHGLRWPEKEMI